MKTGLHHMSRKQKIVVVGNCQARPIAQYLESFCSNVEVTQTLIVHLLKNEDHGTYKQYLDDADVIISQLVFDTYHCDFVKTSVLKNSYPQKVVGIVNLYFSGYFPDYSYLKPSKKGTLQGPLSDYHCKTVLYGWKNQLAIEETSALMIDKSFYLKHYGNVVSESFAELEQRESLVDVKISDFISENHLSNKLFFSFNHPTKRLLVEYVNRLIQTLGLRADVSDPISKFEPLGQIRILSSPICKPEDEEDCFSGFEISGHGEGSIELGNKVKLTRDELVASFYKVYDFNRPEILEFIKHRSHFLPTDNIE